MKRWGKFGLAAALLAADDSAASGDRALERDDQKPVRALGGWHR